MKVPRTLRNGAKKIQHGLQRILYGETSHTYTNYIVSTRDLDRARSRCTVLIRAAHATLQGTVSVPRYHTRLSVLQRSRTGTSVTFEVLIRTLT
jgi:hypothetical protein